jgi:hypothetical protein|tara:strand:- start:1227 stop:1466 length:240 start_codon:yes stop_codon:yes gene_type:complete
LEVLGFKSSTDCENNLRTAKKHGRDEEGRFSYKKKVGLLAESFWNVKGNKMKPNEQIIEAIESCSTELQLEIKPIDSKV